MKKWIIGVVVLGTALLAPRFARAHEGHAHTVMGTIASIDGSNLMVKTGENKQTMVMMDDKTKITQGKAKVDAKTLKVGDRVVATGMETQGMIAAQTVKVAEATAAKK